MKSTLFINILTARSLTSKEDGRELLQSWINLLPDYIPAKYGNWEPLRSEFNPTNLDLALESWAWPFLMKRSQPKMEGSVWMGSGAKPVHGWIHFALAFKQKFQSQMVKFLKEISVSLNADFAFIHLLTNKEVDADINRGAINPLSKADLGVTTHDLIKYLPDIYWGTVFGKPYIDLFSTQKLLSSPSTIIQQISTDAIYLQLTENLSDLETDYESFNTVRQSMKGHLNSHAFLDADLGNGQNYNTPKFEFRL